MTAMAKAITESMSTTADKLLETAKTFLSKLAPTVTIDDNGKPKVTFGISKVGEMSQELEEVLAVPEQ